jgi:DNA mismatch repair protein MutS
MCGIPYRASNSYIKRLLDEGKKIAITAQTELISEAKSDIINREVVQIITPATVIEDDFLNSRESSYILSISFSKKETFVSYSDITTGEFYLQSFEKDSTFQKLSAFLTQIGPREILVNEDDYFVHTDLAHLLDDTGIMITKLPSRDFSIKKVFSIDEKDKDLGSADALLKYIKDSSRSSLSQIIAYTKESDSSYLQIDASTRKSLEILKNTQDGGESNTLFSTIDKP